MNYLSVCSGIEAASVAWHPLGFKPVAFSEIEPFPSAVLAHHWPDVPNLGDMTKHGEWGDKVDLSSVDVLVGGTPCQAFSVAGLRNSLKDERGNLTLIYINILNQIDEARNHAGRPAAVCVWENVPGVLNTSDNAFGCFLGGLAGSGGALQPPDPERGWEDAGYVRGPQRRIAWRCLDAQYFGLAQRRKRVFVVAGAGDGFRPEQVLFEFQGLQRHSPPGREAGEGASSSPSRGSHWSGGPHPSLNQSNNTGGVGMSNQEIFSQQGAGLVADSSIAPPLTGNPYGDDVSREGLLVSTVQDVAETPLGTDHKGPGHNRDRNFVTHSLRGEGFDASEDGGNVLAVPCGIDGSDLAYSLRSNPSHSGDKGDGGMNTTTVVSFQPRYFTRDNKTGNAESCGDVVPAISSQHSGGDSAPCVAFYPTNRQPEFGNYEDISPAAKVGSGGSCGNPPAVAYDITTGGGKRKDRPDGQFRVKEIDAAPTLDGSSPTSNQGGAVIAQAFSIQDGRDIAKEQNGLGINDDGAAYTLDQTGAQAVAFAIQAGAIKENPNHGPDGVGVRADDLSYTLEARSEVQAVAYIGGIDNENNGFEMDAACGPLMKDSPTGGGRPLPAVAFAQNTRDEVREMAVVGALAAEPGMKQTSYIRTAMQVRRLTPTECERLQGFPDGWTDIRPKGKDTPDGPRYKALGNSMAVPVMRFIGTRLAMLP